MDTVRSKPKGPRPAGAPQGRLAITLDGFVPSAALLAKLRGAECWFAGKPMFMQCSKCGRGVCSLRKSTCREVKSKPKRKITFEEDGWQ